MLDTFFFLRASSPFFFFIKISTPHNNRAKYSINLSNSDGWVNELELQWLWKLNAKQLKTKRNILYDPENVVFHSFLSFHVIISLYFRFNDFDELKTKKAHFPRCIFLLRCCSACFGEEILAFYVIVVSVVCLFQVHQRMNESVQEWKNISLRYEYFFCSS